MKKFVVKCLENNGVLFLAIVYREGNRHIGNIKLGPISWKHKNAEIGIIIGEKDCWGKGYARQAIELLSEYAFSKLKLHKLTAGCYANNIGSVKAFEKAGFVQEGRKISQYLCEGKYVDGVLLGKVGKK